MKPRETDSPGELHFHYNREDREAGLSEYARRNLHQPKGFFRRNRSLVITLVDLSVLVLLFFVIYFYLKMAGPSQFTEGLALTTEANRTEDRIFVTLTFERTEDAGPFGVVRVSLRLLPADERIDLTGILPDDVGGTCVLRDVFTTRDQEVRLFANIDFETESKVVEVEVVDTESGE